MNLVVCCTMNSVFLLIMIMGMEMAELYNTQCFGCERANARARAHTHKQYNNDKLVWINSLEIKKNTESLPNILLRF